MYSFSGNLGTGHSYSTRLQLYKSLMIYYYTFNLDVYLFPSTKSKSSHILQITAMYPISSSVLDHQFIFHNKYHVYFHYSSSLSPHVSFVPLFYIRLHVFQFLCHPPSPNPATSSVHHDVFHFVISLGSSVHLS